jgi:anti-sigma regulatory factor (Ser/Thr protein kinase)
MELPHDGRAEIAGIRKSAEYLQRLSSGLRLLVLDPSRGQSRGAAELHAWWNDAFLVLRNALPQPIALRQEFPSGDCWLGIAPTALTQLVLNLVQNAGNAMAPRGSGSVRIVAENGDGRVRLSVVDDGPGMSEDVRRRCMQPFFTTRSRGQATGLGLVLVYGLVQQIGGSVEVVSAPGEGTSFILTLPTAAPLHPEDPDRPLALVSVSDPRVRALVIAQLDGLNVQVGTEADGRRNRLVVADRFDARDFERWSEHSPDCLVALIGDHPEGAAPARVWAAGPNPSPSALRQLLRDVVSSMRAGEAPRPARADQVRS